MSINANKQYRLKKPLKKKVFLSNELKRSLLIAFLEAKHNKVCLTLDILLYGLISQQNSIAAKLVESTISQFKNNKNLTSQVISNRIKELNREGFNSRFKLDSDNSKVFSSEFWDENSTTPWLSPEVKDILKLSTTSLVKAKTGVVIVGTKHILFELLNKEPIRNLLTQVIN